MMELFLCQSQLQKCLWRTWVVTGGISVAAQSALVSAFVPILVADFNIAFRLERIEHILFRRHRFVFFREIGLIRQLFLGVLLLRRRGSLRPNRWMTDQKQEK